MLISMKILMSVSLKIYVTDCDLWQTNVDASIDLFLIYVELFIIRNKKFRNSEKYVQ